MKGEVADSMIKILNMFGYNRLSIMQKSAIWFTFANILNTGLTVITTPIFTRLLTSADIGKYGVYTTWYNIFCTLITLNLAYGMYETLLVDYEEDQYNLTSSLAMLTLIFCFIGLIIFGVFNVQIANILSLDNIYLFVMVMDIFANLMCTFFETSNRFQFNYKKCVLFTVFLSVSRVLLSLFLVIILPTNKLFGRIIGMTIPYLLAGIFLFILFIRQGPCCFKTHYWKTAVRFNIVLVPHYLSSTILSSSDRVMIAKMVNDSKAGIYSICYSCAALMGIFFSAINSVYTPYSYRALRDKKYQELKKNTNVLVSLSTIPALLLVLFSPEAIAIFAPKEYYEGIWMMPPLVLGIYFTFLYYLFSNVEFYYKKSGYVTIATMVGAIVNIGLNYLLIPRIGYFAAAYTTFVGYMLMAIMHYCFYRRVIKEKVYDMKSILKSVIFLIIASFGILIVYPYLVLRIAIFLLLILILRKRIINDVISIISLKNV